MGQITVSKDGQPVVLPFEEVTGQQLKEQLSIPDERIVTVKENGQTRQVGENERLRLQDGVVVSDAPRYRYGSGGDPAIAHRLSIECAYIQLIHGQYSDFGFDPQLDRWWVQLPQFELPQGWNYDATPILVTVNDHYPLAAPDGFFLSNALRDVCGHTPGHYFEARSAHNPLSAQEWAWFCIHPQVWKPTIDVRDGDSIVKYLTLIHLAMSQVIAPSFRG